MKDDIAIKVEHVSKTFKLPHEKTTTIKGAVVNFYKRNKSYETQQALKDISFEVKKGEFFGIVGRNGSGKSTLLKLLAGIYTPSKGGVTVNGKLTPFIELGVGFNPELSGRENVFLNGALLGFNRKEMYAMYDEIVEFAELERFMDQKLKNYSSGMQVRLAFSIAIRAKSDILLFDEVLAVGDASFQQKCYDVFAGMITDGRTVVLVTHDMSAIQRFCERAILINKGRIEITGDPIDIADKYLEQNFNNNKQTKKGESSTKNNNFSIEEIALTSSDNGPTKSFGIYEDIHLGFKLINKLQGENMGLGVQIFSNTGVYCFGTNSVVSKAPALVSTEANVSIVFKQTLTPGTYHISLAVMDKTADKVYMYSPKVATFNIKQQTQIQGTTLMETIWSIS